eukprot:TRINITY_DN5817_c0_g1_i4.p1 TRINITY_DN5817_c0_g1~~TRINITY_DN5817_c0_g1_i4.p1  ORF type:complete len:282 (+),score=51.50 TRINITY_DN5817_c0_g1_i4:62-907(+)
MTTSEVAHMDMQTVADIDAFLTNNGGWVDLGKLSTAFPGVKRAQLTAAGFAHEVVANVNLIGSNISLEAPSEADVLSGAYGSSRPKKTPDGGKKRKALLPPSERPLPNPLEDRRLEEIWRFVESFGGSVALGKLCTEFSGVKKAQLEAHFEVAQIGSGVWSVTIPGYEPVTGSEPKPQKQIMQTPMPGMYGNAVRIMSFGVQGAPSGPSKKKKRTKTIKDPDALPDLTPTQIEHISTYLMENNGFSDLGRVMTKFPGIKKVQLQPHFVFSGTNQDPIVSLQ